MKLKSLLIFSFLITSVSFAETVTTNTQNVPLQKSSVNSCVIDLIPINTTLQKTGETDSFYNVTFNGTSGSIYKRYTIEGQKSVPDILPSSVPKVSKNSIVKTNLSGALPAVNEDQLTFMIDKYCKNARRTNLLKLVPYFVEMQEKYNVNAVFAVAASIQESGGGTSGKLINTYYSYNLFSIKGRNPNNGKYVTFKSQKWRKYSGFKEAIMDFGHWIVNSDYYFKKGNYTPYSIGKIYCNEKWGIAVSDIMKSLYNTLKKYPIN